ncbi:Not1-domain-containing protein [Ascodesmis nigricans]|uniref:General negative regulator of transcription subunit 1 n=1 Tax=Ascodesmis nigricans TaxID=341454 RepID=A0A4S2MSZ4_9PEZI|nr:Not1-domain-containing protein [Ascodesmis nigricans]
MDVSHRVLRKLISDNYNYIFQSSGSRNNDFRVLVDTVKSIAASPETAKEKFADAITPDLPEPTQIFRNFDLATFMNQLGLDAFQRAILALGFKSHRNADLQKKGMEILQKSFNAMLDILAMPSKYENMSDNGVAHFLKQLISEPVPDFLDSSLVLRLSYAVRCRYKNKSLPPQIAEVTDPIERMRQQESLVGALEQFGPECISDLDRARNLVSRKWNVHVTEKEIAEVLTYMALHRFPRQWNSANFVQALMMEGNLGPNFDWSVVIDHFDREDFILEDPAGLVVIVDAIRTGTQGQQDFPIYHLWGTKWQHKTAQWTVLHAYLHADRLDVAHLPGIRKVFTGEDFEAANANMKAVVASLEVQKLISYDAVEALLYFAFEEDVPRQVQQEAVNEVQRAIKRTPELLLCGALMKQPPLSPSIQELINILFDIFFKGHTSNALVFWRLWQLNRAGVANKFYEYYTQNPMSITRIMDISQDIRCLTDLLEYGAPPFMLEVASLAARREYLNLEIWLKDMLVKYGYSFWTECYRFLRIKAEAEYTHTREGSKQNMVSLRVGPVYTFLTVLDECDIPAGNHEAQEAVTATQRICIQAYPRLINMGGKHDAVILSNNAESNSFPTQVDKDMQQAYRKLYAQDSEISEVVDYLQKIRDSDDPYDQDLFACMVHGMFDEYDCYQSYPIHALATTAVLFGSLIRFKVIDNITLRVALAMVLHAVRDHTTAAPMYKFGLQALVQFKNRLPEWRTYCGLLSQVPGLQGTDVWNVVQEVLNSGSRPIEPPMNGTATIGDGRTDAPNGIVEQPPPSPSQSYPPFHSINVDGPQDPYIYEGPEEDVQDKVLFIVNNVSQSNLDSKLKELHEWLHEPHYSWFADYLVVKRAKLEPNYHQLYLSLVENFGERALSNEVLRETYNNVKKLLNSENTLSNSTERGHLKNLGSWLGGLTIAKDRPIKFKNISFKDLLIEGFQTDRLTVVLPFTCKVLEQATKSTVFKPPNPWIMAILRLLKELYERVSKLNLKFEIEVLFKNFDMDLKALEPATDIQEIEEREAMRAETEAGDAAALLDNLSLQQRAPEYLPFASQIPGNLVDKITINSSVVRDPHIKRIVVDAIQRTALEILGPVVERSVTIASIATSQLVSKDFATEPNEQKMRKAAVGMAQRLAGHLALVTCKEPMRLSMVNNIRTVLSQAGVGESVVSEQAIAMVVNENLETVCQTVEEAAETAAVGHVDDALGPAYALRRRYNAQKNPQSEFLAPGISRYAMQLPDVFRLQTGGLTAQQYAVYEEFARGGPASNVEQRMPISQQHLSLDGPPVDYLPGNLQGTPGLMDPPMMDQRSMEPPKAPPSPPASDVKNTVDKLMEAVANMREIAVKCDESRIHNLSTDHAIFHIIDGICEGIIHGQPRETRDAVASHIALFICNTMYSIDEQSMLEVESLALLLKRLCSHIGSTAKDVAGWLFGDKEEDRLFHVMTTMTLIRMQMIPVQHLDEAIARKINARNPLAIEFLVLLIEESQKESNLQVFRSHFISSLEAAADWVRQDPKNEKVRALVGALQGPDWEIKLDGNARIDQLEYIFVEWIHLYQHTAPSQKHMSAFLLQMQRSDILADLERTGEFFKCCLTFCVNEYEACKLKNLSLATDCYLAIDAFAKMVLLLARYHSPKGGDKTVDKASYFDSVLALVILVFNHQVENRSDASVIKIMARFYSTLFFEFDQSVEQFGEYSDRILETLANGILALQPSYFPTFAFAWLSLICHRLFMPKLLRTEQVSKGQEIFTKILSAYFRLLNAVIMGQPLSHIAKILHQGALRTFLVIHHDFPDYLAAYSFPILDEMSIRCVQLRNLVLSALPRGLSDFPDPFGNDLQFSNVEDMKTNPVVRGDYLAALNSSGLKEIVDGILASGQKVSDEDVKTIMERLYVTESVDKRVVDTSVINSLVLYVGIRAIESSGKTDSLPTFNSESAEVELLVNLTVELPIEGRYYILAAMANHLRYPNTHTYWFHNLVLHIFDHVNGHALEEQVHEQVLMVLLERLIVHRPHPWGIIVTQTELFRKRETVFWQLGAVRQSEEVRATFGRLLGAMNP